MRHAFMTGLGLGYAPVASGTFGSAGAIVIAAVAWAVLHYASAPVWVLPGALAVLTVLATIGCGAWGAWAAAYFAGRSRKPGDPGQVVLDEWAGQWLALIAIPMGSWRAMLIAMAVQFFLFRLFDVWKPPPGRRLEKLPAGWGIVADDLLAGLYANLIGQVVLRYVLWKLIGNSP